MIAALGDHQVNTLGAHIMARAVGAKLIRPAVGEIFELETVDPPHRGSALVELTSAMSRIRSRTFRRVRVGTLTAVQPRFPAAARLVDHFLKTGEAGHFCDGICNPN